MSDNSLYYISGRRRKRGRSQTVKKWWVLPILFLLIILLLNLQFFPLLADLAKKEAERRIELLLTDAITKEIADNNALYSEIITLTYKENGSVSSLRADTAKLIAFRTTLLKRLMAYISEDTSLSVAVPLASVLGLNFFPSAPSLHIALRLSESMNAYFLSRFEERGINQTKHSILFYLTLDILVLVPSNPQKITVSREFPFAETIIVGDVPDAYTKISRLTDDITESEIDDIYDFGADTN